MKFCCTRRFYFTKKFTCFFPRNIQEKFRISMERRMEKSYKKSYFRWIKMNSDHLINPSNSFVFTIFERHSVGRNTYQYVGDDWKKSTYENFLVCLALSLWPVWFSSVFIDFKTLILADQKRELLFTFFLEGSSTGKNFRTFHKDIENSKTMLKK